jgi:arsenate reductase-like glutaredoxin family protein
MEEYANDYHIVNFSLEKITANKLISFFKQIQHNIFQFIFRKNNYTKVATSTIQENINENLDFFSLRAIS